MFRQGDLLFKPIKKALGKAIKHNGGSYIVAEGERTGHHHLLKDGKFSVKQFNDRRFLIVEIAALLSHQEHDTITIERGTYEIVREREFDYELKSVRQVQD